MLLQKSLLIFILFDSGHHFCHSVFVKKGTTEHTRCFGRSKIVGKGPSRLPSHSFAFGRVIDDV